MTNNACISYFRLIFSAPYKQLATKYIIFKKLNLYCKLSWDRTIQFPQFAEQWLVKLITFIFIWGRDKRKQFVDKLLMILNLLKKIESDILLTTNGGPRWQCWCKVCGLFTSDHHVLISSNYPRCHQNKVNKTGASFEMQNRL